MTLASEHPILILWTCPTLEEARQVCYELVEKKLVACANIFPHIESIFAWDDSIESSNEVKVIFKTLHSQFSKVSDYIKEHCSYDVPEISEIAIDTANPDYVQWLVNSVK